METPVPDSINIEQGLAAWFKQPSGKSRQGMDWAIRISGKHSRVVIVRTYFPSDPPQETDQGAMAAKAVLFLRKKLEQGWIPQPGILEAE